MNSQILQQRSFKDYSVTVKWIEALDSQKLTITKKAKVIYSDGEAGSYYWIGNHFDDSLKGSDPHSGKDLTGNGVHDLIITKWNGGAHCCNFLSVFEMSELGLKKIITIDGGSNGFEIKDLESDRIPEIAFWDWPIDYQFNCFADSAQGKVVLKFIDGSYHVASSLMYTRRPTNELFGKLKDEIRKSFKGMGDQVPYELLDLMMKLSYSGYKELAIKTADETWPKEKKGFEKFRSEFKEALSDSIYWSEFNLGKY